MLSVKTWCWWAVRSEEQGRDKVSQSPKACKLSLCEVQTPVMFAKINRQLFDGTDAEEVRDLKH